MAVETVPDTDGVTPADSFLSIAALENALKNRFPQGTFTIQVRDPATGQLHVSEAPRWLFRGESCFWPTSVSSMARLREHSHRLFETVSKEHHERIFRTIENITLRAARSFGDWFGLDQTSSAAFAQHYGLPSEFLDFSRSLEVAIGFAVDNPERWQDSRQALVAVLDVRRAADHAIIADLSVLLEWARRPTAQEAYGFHHQSHIDLKARVLSEDVGLTWYEVTIRPDEAHEHRLLHELLDGHCDAAAGALQLVMDELASNDGGWPFPTVNYFAEMIPPAPFIMQMDTPSGHRKSIGTMVSAEQAGLLFDEEKERGLNKYLWIGPYAQGSPEERHRALVEKRAAAGQHQYSSESPHLRL